MSPRPSSANREKAVTLGVVIVCLASLAVHAGIRAAMTFSLKQKLAQEAQAELAARQQAVQEAEDRFQAELDSAARAVQEGGAAKARAEEFSRRQRMEEEFAQTPQEKRLLEMARVSRESSLGTLGLLEELAKLASPPSSGIRVRHEGRWYALEVAAALSEIPLDTRGGREDAEDLHRAVRYCVAGIIRDLFAFGAPHDLQAVEVAVLKRVEISREAAVLQTRQEYRELFRAGLASRASRPEVWLTIGRPEVLGMMNVRRDDFQRVSPRR